MLEQVQLILVTTLVLLLDFAEAIHHLFLSLIKGTCSALCSGFLDCWFLSGGFLNCRLLRGRFLWGCFRFCLSFRGFLRGSGVLNWSCFRFLFRNVDNLFGLRRGSFGRRRCLYFCCLYLILRGGLQFVGFSHFAYGLSSYYGSFVP